MTEISETDDGLTRPRELPHALEHFILQWGDMGDKWGVNRSVAQIHALLYLSERPLTAEDIAGPLGLARSNVSNSIKELQAWNLIRRVPVKGDRRVHDSMVLQGGGPTLYELVVAVWEGLAAHRTVACLACGGAMTPRYSAGPARRASRRRPTRR